MNIDTRKADLKALHERDPLTFLESLFEEPKGQRGQFIDWMDEGEKACVLVLMKVPLFMKTSDASYGELLNLSYAVRNWNAQLVETWADYLPSRLTREEMREFILFLARELTIAEGVLEYPHQAVYPVTRAH